MNALLEQINSAGLRFVEFAPPMLVQSGALILILLLADFALRKKVRAVFRYWIWLLVLIKLVLPTSLSTPMSVGYFLGDELAYANINRPATETEPMEPAPAIVSPTINLTNIQADKFTPTPAPTIPATGPVVTVPAQPPVESATPLSWQGVVFLLWLSVVMAMGLLLLQRAIFVRGLVVQAKEANGFMDDTLESCRERMGVKRKIGLKVSANATSPAVCGLFRPVILVPKNLTSNLSASQLQAVLLHELAHIKRGDLWVNLVQTLLQIIYFYNPLFWAANCIISRIREQAVDEMVLVAMGEKARQYPQALVDVAKLAFKRPALSLRLIGVVESKSALAGRIKHILNRPMPKRAKLGILGLMIIIITAAILLPMAKAERELRNPVRLDENGRPIITHTLYMWEENEKLVWQLEGETYRHIEQVVGRIKELMEEKIFPYIRVRVPEQFRSQQVPVNKLGRLCRGIGFINMEYKYDLKQPPSPFRAMLPNGVTVELIGLFGSESKGQLTWWWPDGTAMSKEESKSYEYKIKPGHIRNRDDWKFEYGYILRFIPSDDLSSMTDVTVGHRMRYAFPREDGIGVAYVESDEYQRKKGVAKIGEIRIAAAYGQPKSFSSENRVGQDADIFQLDDGATILLSAVRPDRYQPDRGLMVDTTVNAGDVDIKVFYESKDGNIRKAWADGITGGPSLVSPRQRATTLIQETFRLRSIAKEELKKIIVECRRLQGVTFKNVALKPGMKTTITTEYLQPEELIDTKANKSQADSIYPGELTSRRPRQPIAIKNVRPMNPEFTAELDNETSLELLALTKFEGGALRWWSPEGQPIELPSITAQDIKHQGNIAVFRFYGPVDSFTSYCMIASSMHEIKEIWQIASSGIWLGVLGYPKERNFGKLYFRTKGKPGQTLYTIPIKQNDIGKRRAINQYGVNKIQSFERTAFDGFTIELLHDDKLAGDEFAAVDRAGKMHEYTEGYSARNRSYMKYEFPAEELAAIVRQKFSYSTVQFVNVSLQGKKTKVAIERIQRGEPEQPKVNVDVDPRFIATMPNGVKVSLVALGRLVDGSLQWWTPEAEHTSIPDILECDVEGYDVVLAYKVQGSNGFTSYSLQDDQLHRKKDDWLVRSHRLWMVHLDEAAHVGTADFAVRAYGGPLETRLEIPLSEKEIAQEIEINKLGYKKVAEFTEVTPDSFRVKVTYNSKKRALGEFAAVDKAGKTHKRTSGAFWPGQCEVTFPISAKSLSHLVLQRQQIGQATFRNISLQPGQRTKLQIESRQVDHLIPPSQAKWSVQDIKSDVQVESDLPIKTGSPTAIKHAEREKESKQGFTAVLSNGVTVELMGLCKEPVDGAKWWKPDGVYMAEPFFRASKRTPPLKGMTIQYTFLAKARGSEDISIKMKIYEGFGWSTRVAEDGTALCYIKHPNDAKPYHEDAFSQGPIEVGVAQGQWIKGRGESSPNIQTPSSYSIGSHDEIVIQPPRPEKHSPEMATIFWFTSSSHDYEYRLICTLKDGSVEECMKPFFQSTNKIETGNLKKSTLNTKSFNIDRPLEQIVNYELLYRKFDYVRFNNVAFKPNVKTDVQVKVPIVEDVKPIPPRQELLSTPILGYDVKLNFADPAIRDGSFHSEQSVAFVMSFHSIEDLKPRVLLSGLLIGQKTFSLILKDNGITIQDGSTGREIDSESWFAEEVQFNKVITLPIRYGQKEYSCPIHVEMDRHVEGVLTGSYWFCAYLSGRLPWGAGGRSFEIVNLDQQMEFRLQGDGTDKRDAVLGIDIDGDGKIKPAERGGEQFNLYEPFQIGSKTYRVTEVDPYLPRVVFNEVSPAQPFHTGVKTNVQVEIDSVAGQWEYIGEVIPPDFNDTMILTEHINLGSIGQDAEGKIFIKFVRDGEKTQNRQYRFVLVKKDGNILEPDGHIVLGESNRLEEKFTFSEPFVSRRLKGFRFQSRPLPPAGIDNISSQLQKAASEEVKFEKISPSRLAPPGRYAIELDGVDDYLLVPDSPSLKLEPPFTVEMWVKTKLPADASEYRGGWAVISKGFYVGTPRAYVTGFGIKLDRFPKEPSKLYIHFCKANNSGTYSTTYGGYPLTNGVSEWIHITHVFDGEYYKSTPGHPLVMGKFLIPTENPLMGQLGEVRIWNGARTRQELSQYKNVALTGTEPGLAACWTFEQTEGQFAYDISGNNNHARLGKSPDPDNADPKWVDLQAPSPQPGRKTDVQAEIEDHLFSVYGTVTDQSGRPIAGVQLTADCGHEKLERTGRAVTDENGRYTLGLTSSVKVLHVDPYDVGIQTARIEARAQGFYEASLCRQGNLAMAGKPPGPDEQRFVADYAGVVLPHKPYELNFVMYPAARIEGELVDERGNPIRRRGVWLHGDGLLKNTSLGGSANQDGKFAIDHVPCGSVWFVSARGQLVQSRTVNLATPGTYRVQLQFGKSPSGRPTLRIAELHAPAFNPAESAQPRVVDPNSNPVASAQVALCTRDKGVVIRAGKLSPNRMGGRTTTILETDADGSFDFSDRPDDFHLIVAHEKGLAWITREQFTSSPEIRLQSWGRIEGHLYIGRESGADKKMSLLNYINKNAIDQGVRYEYETETDAGGKFVFDKVPPGWLEIGYLTRMGNSSWSQTGRTPVKINPGVTLRVAIGGRGRPVVGKFVPPPGYDRPVYFGEGLRVLDALRPERPKPENYDRMNKRERQQWYNQWSKTPEAGAYYDAMWHDPGRRHYVFHIKKDGSFRIEDVIAGRYKFTVWIEDRLTGQGRPEEIASYYGTIEVPEMPGGRSDEPLDLGDLELTMHNPLRVGDIAPLFEAKTLDGKDLKLIDYRGKFVLLSFWQPVFHPEKQQFQELYDTYGGNRQLEIIGLGGNDTLEEVKNYVRENAIPWPQIYTGEEFKSGIAKDYDIPGIPWIFLIDPEGRIIAKNLRGEKLKSTVNETLKITNVNKTDVQVEVEGR